MADGDATRVVRAGLPDAEQGRPFLPGPTFAAPFHLAGDPATSDYVYGRYGNPTWTLYERALGELEGGEAILFSSGAAAAAAVLLSCLGTGDVLVLPSDGYPAIRSLGTDYLAERGVEVRLVPAVAFETTGALANASLVWIETPSNPQLEVCDLALVAERARGEGALVVVDNTLATPLAQRPLDLGADYSMSSDSKHLTGHGDLVLGHVAVREPERAEALVAWRRQTGAIAGPFEAWLAHRSLATLDVRLDRECANALALARMLVARDDVREVRYPGLPEDPAHERAAAQMRRFGSVLGFDLGTRERAERFLASCRLVSEATSFGGVHSSAERRARWGDDIPEGLIRFSAGCEAAADLLDDVERALDLSRD